MLDIISIATLLFLLIGLPLILIIIGGKIQVINTYMGVYHLHIIFI